MSQTSAVSKTYGNQFPSSGVPVGGKDNNGVFQPLLFDASGRLIVAVSGAGSGGTSSVDQSAFTAGVSAGTPIMAEDPTTGKLLIGQMVPGTRILSVGATITPVESSTVSVPSILTVGTGTASALAANINRKRVTLQNVGTTKIFVLFGTGTASASNYHLVLPAGGTTADGSSPVYSDIMWQGAIQVASSAAGGSLSVAEFS